MAAPPPPSAPPAAQLDPLHAEIASLEDQTWRALSHSGASLIPFLSRDCQMLFPLGVYVTATSNPNLKEVMTSEAFIPWKSYSMSDVKVTELGHDAASITYRVRALRPNVGAPDDGAEFLALVCSVWRKKAESEGWLLVLHQQTPYSDVLVD